MNAETGRGGSVREVIKLVCVAADRDDVVALEHARLAGDPAFLCASLKLIEGKLNFFCIHNSSNSIS